MEKRFTEGPLSSPIFLRCEYLIDGNVFFCPVMTVRLVDVLFANLFGGFGNRRRKTIVGAKYSMAAAL